MPRWGRWPRSCPRTRTGSGAASWSATPWCHRAGPTVLAGAHRRLDDVAAALRRDARRVHIRDTPFADVLQALDDRAADFPRITDAFAGRKARYGYLGHTREWGGGEAEFDGVTKHDLVTGDSRTHIFGGDAVAGETVFAADPDGRAEDDGWLLNLVHDRAVDASHLLVLDAPTLEEVARVHLPRRVPFGFHGDWFAGG